MNHSPEKKGLILVFTGPGKGKTTAALGILFRALGRGMKCGVVQFLKGKWDVQSTPGKGTSVLIEIPLTHVN